MIRPAIIAAAAFTAGYLARSEFQRRRRHSLSGAQKLVAAIAADRGSAWTWAAHRRILDAAEPGEVAHSIGVCFTSDHGGETYAQMERGQEMPELTFISPYGVMTRLDVPDDASGIGGGA